MFKKVFALVLCLLLALAFTACGDKDSADDTKGDAASSTSSENKPMFEGDTNEQITGYIAHAKLIENESKDSGRTCEIVSRDNALVYIYKYTTSFSDPKTVFGNLNDSLDNKKAAYDKIYDEMKALVPTAEAVIVEYYTKEGELALSKKYVSGSDVVTGGAYAPTTENQGGTTENQGGTTENTTGFYGKWSMDYDVSSAVLSLVKAEYPDANLTVDKVTVDYIMEFSEDGKCVAAIKSDDSFYNTLVKTVEDYLKTTTTDANEIKTKLDEYKAKYTKDIIDAEFNMSESGTFTMTGDPNSTGTIVLGGENMEGNMKFVVNGNSLDLIPLTGDGAELQDSKLTFTRK